MAKNGVLRRKQLKITQITQITQDVVLRLSFIGYVLYSSSRLLNFPRQDSEISQSESPAAPPWSTHSQICDQILQMLIHHPDEIWTQQIWIKSESDLTCFDVCFSGQFQWLWFGWFQKGPCSNHLDDPNISQLIRLPMGWELPWCRWRQCVCENEILVGTFLDLAFSKTGEHRSKRTKKSWCKQCVSTLHGKAHPSQSWSYPNRDIFRQISLGFGGSIILWQFSGWFSSVSLFGIGMMRVKLPNCRHSLMPRPEVFRKALAAGSAYG